MFEGFNNSYCTSGLNMAREVWRLQIFICKDSRLGLHDSLRNPINFCHIPTWIIQCMHNTRVPKPLLKQFYNINPIEQQNVASVTIWNTFKVLATSVASLWRKDVILFSWIIYCLQKVRTFSKAKVGWWCIIFVQPSNTIETAILCPIFFMPQQVLVHTRQGLINQSGS